jgi:small neutral amino acid transporter SnatA (MarC family)
MGLILVALSVEMLVRAIKSAGGLLGAS